MHLLEEFFYKKHWYECFIKKSKNHLDFEILKIWEPEQAVMKKVNNHPTSVSIHKLVWDSTQNCILQNSSGQRQKEKIKIK
jgi:hypothetical protein